MNAFMRDQRMHVLCLVLTGVCAVILFVGIGIGIVNGNSNIDYNEYDEYGDDYAKDEYVVAAAFGGSIDMKSFNQGKRAYPLTIHLHY